jgi:penicillin amidase
MTTGGPDAADCYEEEINPANHRQYKRDGKWRDMVVRPVVIRVKEGTKVAEKRFEIEYTEHGKDDGSGEIVCPVVARRGNKAYTLKLTYFDQVGLHEQTYRMCTAKNLAEMKQALGLLQLMEQNVMIGTVQGDIFYVRNGRVPIRAPGYDYKRPVPGNTSKTDWRGIHKFADLLQVENPPTGYMQNCNVSPQFLAKTRLIDPAAWKDRPYLFNGFWGLKAAYDNPLHQRAAMCVELLDKTHDATTQQAIAIATSPDVYGADVWQAMLAKAWGSPANKLKTDKNASGLYQVIQQWNRRCDADGVGAIAYHYWKEHFSSAVKLNDKAGFPPPKSVTEEMLLTNLKRGGDKLIADYGKLDVRFGDVYRVGRIGTQRDWPVSGGSIEGIATPRAISFDPIEKAKPARFLGRGGQTSTQVVLLTKPPKSWTYLPLGESDHPDSPHYDDQARELFSKSRMKSTYFLDKAELLKHVTATKVIKRK